MLPVVESAFDTAFFGGIVWRYDYQPASRPAEIAKAAVAQNVRLVACRIPVHETGGAAALEAAGFRLVERLVTLHRPVGLAPDVDRTVVPATEHDREACIEIAVAALRQDRYHADPHIDDSIGDAIKAAWVSNNLSGRAKVNLVARDRAGRTAGFNQLRQNGRAAVIDLIAVAPWAQRQGYGRALVAGGLLASRNAADTMVVGTQASNLASLALYESLGFKAMQTQLTYHLTPGSQS